jgi:mannose-1-phosphate guanylyltransferase/mannose-6-phosphate isomerase
MDFVRVDKDTFSACESISVDYAVMEKTDNAMVVPFTAGWSDIGSWDAVHQVTDKDDAGNAVRGDTILMESENCYVHADSRLVATLGLRDISIVETSDCVLVAHNDYAQNTKKIAELLKKTGRTEADIHMKVYRPWGCYQTINMGTRFQVKRITVKPGARLSLQKHHHRAEHWIVVEGTAIVTCNDQELMLTENQSTYLPLGATHRLHNPGKIPLELIEVQSGSYLGEDDIVRFEDVYGRGN